MKIYLYCTENGVYQGEDFAEKGFLRSEGRELPPGCTTIAPPEYARGEVPVFEVTRQRWVVRPLSAIAPLPQKGRDLPKEQ